MLALMHHNNILIKYNFGKIIMVVQPIPNNASSLAFSERNQPTPTPPPPSQHNKHKRPLTTSSQKEKKGEWVDGPSKDKRLRGAKQQTLPDKNIHCKTIQPNDADCSSRVTCHHLSMNGTIYLEYIMNGTKLFEGRVNGPVCQRMQIGDELRLFDQKAQWGIVCKIVSKDVYPGFEDMLKDKGILNMLPQLQHKASSLSAVELLREGVKIYHAFPGSQRVKQVGAMAIGVKFSRKVFN